MEKGTVKWFNQRKNFGFIERDDGTDVFVHASDIEGTRILSEGDEVSFEIEEAPRGPKALNVKVEESSTEEL